MVVFRSSRLDAYFLTIIAGIENTERVASDFSNECRKYGKNILRDIEPQNSKKFKRIQAEFKKGCLL